MAWISRESVSRNLVGLLAVMGILLASWLLWQWLLVAVGIVLPCVIALFWVSRAGKKQDSLGRIDNQGRRHPAKPKWFGRRR